MQSIDWLTENHHLRVNHLRLRMMMIATFQHTPRLSSKGTVGGGNASRIGVYHRESYCTALFCGNEALQKVIFFPVIAPPSGQALPMFCVFCICENVPSLVKIYFCDFLLIYFFSLDYYSSADHIIIIKGFYVSYRDSALENKLF